jgi:hypothetical protein
VWEFIAFADDLLLFAADAESLKKWTQAVATAINICGLKLGVSKCGAMCLGSPLDAQPIKTDDGTIQPVAGYTYLGTIVDANGDATRDVNWRISAAACSFHKHNRIMKCRRITCKTPLLMARALVFSRLFHCMSTLPLTQRNLNRISSFYNRVLRACVPLPMARLLSDGRWRKVTVEELRERVRRALPESRRQQNHFYQHSGCGGSGMSLGCRQNAQSGNHFRRWFSRRQKLAQNLLEDLNAANIDPETTWNIAENREQWKIVTSRVL